MAEQYDPAIDSLEGKYFDETGKQPKNKKGKYTSLFKKWNLKQLKDFNSNVLAFSKNKLYNPYTKRLVNRSSFFTKANQLRKKYKNTPLFSINRDVVVWSQPYLNKLKPMIMKAEQQQVNKEIEIDFNLLNNRLENLLNILRPTTTRYLLSTTNETGGKMIYTLNTSTMIDLVLYMIHNAI